MTDDPLRHLTPLQRDIILCIQQASADEGAGRSMYPDIHADEREPWPGVNVRVIVAAARARSRQLTSDEFRCVRYLAIFSELSVIIDDAFRTAIEYLLDNEIIDNPVDDQHYCCL